jgi:eukaryotic-like serine/threonine-protein kinase
MAVPQSDAVLAGRYRLDGKIAVGGMGEVWRGEDTVLARPVAIKLIRTEFAGDAETLTRFRAEARHSAALSHPGIAHVYDYGEDGPTGSPFIVMELVNGPSLTELLAGGPLPPGRVMDVVAQAATALAAAHAAGLVHRDIKPGNILIARGGTVKITDFGIAYAAGSAPLTRTGTLIGTPAYLAPERIAGSPGSPASDLYALGIVAYECLAGTLPYSGTPVQVTLEYSRRGLPPLPDSIPAPVAALVTELTARDPAARPASAAQVAAHARQLRDALPYGALPSVPSPFESRPFAGPPFEAQPFAGPPFGAQPFGAQPSFEPPGGTQHSGLTVEPVAVWAAGPPRSLADTEPPTLTDLARMGADGLPPGPQPAWRGRRRSRGPALLAVAAVAVVAVVGGWMLARDISSASPTQGSGSSSHAPATGSGHQAQTPAAPVVNTVYVNGQGLIGLPVSQAVQQVRQLGLTVQVVLIPSLDQRPGTVLSVEPSGQVQPGSTVVLDAAVSPLRQRHRPTAGGGNGGLVGG